MLFYKFKNDIKKDRAAAHHAMAVKNGEKGYLDDVKEGVYHDTEKGEKAKDGDEGVCLDAEKRDKREKKRMLSPIFLLS